jgi:transcriptional regulator with XRE-family HTH domain
MGRISLGAAALKAWRGERKQADVAKALALQQSAWSSYENGMRLPTRAVAVRLQQVTGIPVADWDRPGKAPAKTRAKKRRAA